MRFRAVGSWAALILFAALAGSLQAGLLDAVHVRAKADAPLEADQPGYQVILIDTHSDVLLVGGDVVVPESFGKVDAASLDVVGPDGQHLGEASLAPAIPAGKTPAFEFRLRRDCLANSTVTLSHFTADSVDVVVVHLGTFGVRDRKNRGGPPAAPKVQLALAEQGVYGNSPNDFERTDNVPLEEGRNYGFRLYFRGDGRSVPLRIEWTLPAAPKTWGEVEELKHMNISADGRTATETRAVPTEKLLDNGGWTVAEGDPEGDYVARIFVGDELLKTFVFHVRRPGKPTGDPAGSPPSAFIARSRFFG